MLNANLLPQGRDHYDANGGKKNFLLKVNVIEACIKN
jgi:hypothetical protein